MADKNRNPKNENTTLFKKLTRVFSGPLTTRRRQNYRKLRRSHLNNYSSRFKSVTGQTFQKTSFNPFEQIQHQRIQNQNRAERYREFDQMEYEPLIAAALDSYADEMTTSTAIRPVLNISSKNEEIRVILESFFYDTIGIEENLHGWARTMCKYGDFMAYADIDPSDGVTSVYGLPMEQIERLEGEDQTNPNYVQYQWNSAGQTYEAWQILHFRINANDKYAPYGTSVLEPARRAWRQLTLLEDTVMAYRIVRSPERRVFYIDVGNVDPQNVEQFMQKIITNMKRHQIVDEDTGRVDLRYNPFSVDEDYFIPIRGNTNTKVETLPGGTYTGDIDDIQYFKDKLVTSLKIPQAYLSRGQDGSDADSTLAQKDIRFARTIMRLQQSLVSELTKLAQIHLFVLGYPKEDIANFDLSLNNPSKIADLQELETWRTKIDAANSISEQFFSKRWVYDKIFGLSEEEIIRIQREKIQDAKFDAMLEQIAAGDAGGMGDLGGLDDSIGDLDDSIEDLDADLEADMDLGDETGDEGDFEEGDLLATPSGKRDEYTTPRSKGKKYRPVTTDKRNMGARKRHMNSKYKKEKGTSTRRNVFPNMGFNSLSSGIINENEDRILSDIFGYEERAEEKDERRKILNEKSKMMIESLKLHLDKESVGDE